MSKALEAILVLALVAALPAVAAASETDTVKAEAKKATGGGPDCSEPLRDAEGKPTAKYDPRCTEEMIKAAVAKKKADAASAGEKGGYDLAKIEGLEGLGKSPEGEAAAGEKEYGTLEDIFGLGRRFKASEAYAEPAASDDDDSDAGRG